ncbi:hypothetical protein ESY86_04825 [Subsaximicrobium wynnwilliamsii]|uniref:Uncharacterized protein n=1 Tax=Subsaximicrobium wynnwilliamsii TaxID=291179 RepID=A0A5C6ZJT4_9FLAO|nr:FUSC family membrane protein [Subsaximicrobium wynnwilliamsii]TXD84398.1 hypothetical protein ESY87_04605 [Subsaximicrobium wynnwilliamsii]TXD90079.1 hypothetical protein ESY86_04825 [Subsaximicrobium wynnwilliamsii]TXE04131.1 hypothetical protein ESY88_04600 [Subsaximicrobium wynnwilliamsii]
MLKNAFKELVNFFKSTNFSKAILIGIAISVPIVLGLSFDRFEIGLAVCFGAFWCSPSDVHGSLKHKTIGILYSAALVMLVSFIAGYLHLLSYFLIVVLGLLTFGIAYISVYGFRASLISFSGLLALVLSFAHQVQELEIYEYSLLIGLGGLWYLLLSVIWYHLNPRAQTEEVLAEIFERTANFLVIRGKLIGPQENRKDLLTELLTLQNELIEKHATMRDILMATRINSGKSNYEGKQLLIFVQLVELLETAIANPVNYVKMDALLTKHPEYIKKFQSLIFELAIQLTEISRHKKNPKKLPEHTNIVSLFLEAETQIKHYKKELNPSDYDGYLMMRNLLAYQEQQFERIKRIKWLLSDPDLSTTEFITRDSLRRFIVSQDYDPKLLLRNFSFKSTIFKHCLRLAATMMIGYGIGKYFDFQNPYWILLTIIVIMRPSYGLTKTRSKDRILGTLIGGAIATGLVFVVQNPYVYGVLGISSLVIAFSMLQKNYKASATFITLSVIFIYAIIRPDVLNVIQYRIIDTLIGATLSFLAMLWLWPAWGFMDIGDNIKNSLKANREFFKNISEFYKQKGQIPTAFKVSRKEAFVQTSNLSAAFQRMAQEPESKQKSLNQYYELVVLNHNFLSSLASLSTYLQHHKTTEASAEFSEVAEVILNNLDTILKNLDLNKEPRELSSEVPATPTFDSSIEIASERIKKEAFANLPHLQQHQEAHLIWEQMNWLLTMSDKLLRLSAGLDLE